MLETIFNEEIIKTIKDWDYFEDTSFPAVGINLILRPLSSTDYEKGFFSVLKELTDVGHVDEKLFISRFNAMKSCPSSYYVIVIEDTEKNLIVGCASLIVEQKFIHGCSSRGRIEDVVVSNNYRRRDLGKILVSTLMKLSEKLGCYKVTLECKDALIPFYEKLGLRREDNNSNYLQKRFHH